MAQDVYKDILMEHNISPTRIHNVDVSNSFVVQKHKRYLHKLEENRCRQGTSGCGLPRESIRTLYTHSFYFPMQKLEK